MSAQPDVTAADALADALEEVASILMSAAVSARTGGLPRPHVHRARALLEALDAATAPDHGG
jgi:hypothetical protein